MTRPPTVKNVGSFSKTPIQRLLGGRNMVPRVTNRNATRQRQNVPSEWHQSLERDRGWWGLRLFLLPSHNLVDRIESHALAERHGPQQSRQPGMLVRAVLWNVGKAVPPWHGPQVSIDQLRLRHCHRPTHVGPHFPSNCVDGGTAVLYSA